MTLADQHRQLGMTPAPPLRAARTVRSHRVLAAAAKKKQPPYTSHSVRGLRPFPLEGQSARTQHGSAGSPKPSPARGGWLGGQRQAHAAVGATGFAAIEFVRAIAETSRAPHALARVKPARWPAALNRVSAEIAKTVVRIVLHVAGFAAADAGLGAGHDGRTQSASASTTRDTMRVRAFVPFRAPRVTPQTMPVLSSLRKLRIAFLMAIWCCCFRLPASVLLTCPKHDRCPAT
jgi:hypothetical protein